MAGAAFGDVGMSLFVAGGSNICEFCEIAGAQDVVLSNTKCVSKARKVTSAGAR